MHLENVSVHNLKKISITLDLNQLIVFTGVSGSGKSSLAFDTIYVEGQRRYIDSLSTYARRAIGNFPKPEATRLEGIPPTIAIDQKSSGKNPRSTVGTMTAIYDYLRVLYARLGEPYCPISKEKVSPTSRGSIVEKILLLPKGEKRILLAPIVKGKKGELKDLFTDLIKKGFLRIRIDERLFHLGEEEIELDKGKSHDIDVVIDRIVVSPEERSRIAEAVENGLNIGMGLLSLLNPDTGEEELFSEHGYSQKSGHYYKPLEPEDFSFNHPKGMCPTCHGLGYIQDFNLDLIINPEKSIQDDCCSIASSYHTIRWGNIYNNLARLYNFKVTTPWKNLSEEAKKVFLYGIDAKWTRMVFTHPVTGAKWVDFVAFHGVLHEAKKRFSEASSELYREKISSLMHTSTCPKCSGSRLADYPSACEFKGKTLPQLCEMTIGETSDFFSSIDLTPLEWKIGETLLDEIKTRLQFLCNVGLHYLTLSRTSPTLSGGESQRVRLASQIGFGLVKTAYILDEPSIGLHPRDNELLLKTLRRLTDKGNTVIVVEHDEETIRAADTIVDIGPYAGARGGEVLCHGSFNDLLNAEKSITGAYLSGRKTIPIPKHRRKPKNWLTIIGASHHNLKDVDVSIPLGLFTAITGVSGSGKSSLITDILYPALSNHLTHSKLEVGKHKRIEQIEQIEKVIAIDQSPIGRTPRSNPATYIKVFDDIRDLFASLPESKAFGYKPGRFSFNVREGSCFHCRGMGELQIDMDFMEDEWVVCPSCQGKRFDPKTLSVTYKGKNIHDVLEMSIEEASEFFADIPSITKKLSFLIKVGLGYIQLGQSATTLSGGEAQRIKLSKELVKKERGHTLYILDEPTTGLHFYDIHKLVEILQELTNQGNSVLVIEHNTDLIKTTDYVIDLGPEGGKEGGQVIGQGTPEEIAKQSTPTGIHLKRALYPNQEISQPTKRPEVLPIESIKIRGAKQNNLKNLTLSIPHNQISLFTGPSGSGKSSLAFETIYAEGQRRYIDSLSGYAKRFVKQMPKSLIEEIDGLSPAISIEQKKHSQNPRSTLGTMTEIYDYLRLLFARLGTPHCPKTKEVIESITPEFVVSRLKELPLQTKLVILAPIELVRNQEADEWKSQLQKQGYLRIRLNGTYYELDQEIPYRKEVKNKVELVIDRVLLKEGIDKRLLEAIESASELGNKQILIDAEGKDLYYNLAFAVPSTGESYPPITPHTFSFNSPEGMCLECMGLGFKWGVDLSKESNLLAYSPCELFDRLMKGLYDQDLFQAFCKARDLPYTMPIRSFSSTEKHLLFHGDKEKFPFMKAHFRWIGLNNLLLRIAKWGASHLQEEVSPYLGSESCSACGGTRLNPLARHVTLNDLSLGELCQKPLSQVATFLTSLAGTKVLNEVIQVLKHRVALLIEVGLEYLSLERRAPTLSGGEVQRTLLAKQLASEHTGVLYVLDEPTIGLHPHNNEQLNKTLHKLKDQGNTLILVEHDPLTIRQADRIYDFGPKSGSGGGFITAQGTFNELVKNPHSLTGAYLSGKLSIPLPKKRRQPETFLTIKGAKTHNLKDLSLKIPLHAFTCITGVSGSGKSTLLFDLLLPALQENLRLRAPKDTILFQGAEISNIASIDSLIDLDQSPIGQTIRSDVATYTDLLTPLRTFFASLPEAKTKGLLPKHFSYNHPAGMCKKCRGLGFEIIQLEFLPPAKVECDSCHGHRLSTLSLGVTYKGKNLGQLLKLTAEEAKDFLPDIPKIKRLLARMESVGLSYLTLGQEIQTLSGGEASRLRLLFELSRSTKKHALYLFDEPTTGLHFDDIAKLLPIFQSLVDRKNTLIIIEHNVDLIEAADYVIDLGPGPGVEGGSVVATGTPEEISRSPKSVTGRYLYKKTL